MKPLKILTILTGMSLAISAQATEDATWGQVKQQQTLTSAAKIPQHDPLNNSNPLLGKLMGNESGIIKVRGGNLKVESKTRNANQRDDLKVNFCVPSGALDKNTHIEMAVHGETLEELVIAFAPGGLVFNIPATVKIKIGADRVNSAPTGLRINHEYSDGTVEEAVVNTFRMTGNGDVYVIEFEVPGFSRYSWGGGGP